MDAKGQIPPGSTMPNLQRLAGLNRFAKSIYESNADNPTINIMDITNPELPAFLLGLN